MTRLRSLVTSLGLAALLLLVPAVASAQLSYRFWVQAVDEAGVRIGSGIRCQVYTAGSDTASTIYSNATLATRISGASIAGDSNGQCEWYSAAATAVDLYVWHRNARGVSLAITPYSTHRVILTQSQNFKIVKIPYTTSSANKILTGYTIPKGAAVWDVYIQSVVASGGNSIGDYHIAIGTQGTNHGFCTGGATTVAGSAFGVDLHTSTSSGGWLRCHAVLGTADKSAMDYYITAFHSGALVSRGAVGNSTVAAAAHLHAGSYIRFPYISGGTTNDQVTYTTRGSAVAGHFYLTIEAVGLQD